MAMQVPFKKALAQSFARHCCSCKKKNKFVSIKAFKFIKLFRKQRKPN